MWWVSEAASKYSTESVSLVYNNVSNVHRERESYTAPSKTLLHMLLYSTVVEMRGYCSILLFTPRYFVNASLLDPHRVMCKESGLNEPSRLRGSRPPNCFIKSRLSLEFLNSLIIVHKSELLYLRPHLWDRVDE